jgi:hypothetical protein
MGKTNNRYYNADSDSKKPKKKDQNHQNSPKKRGKNYLRGIGKSTVHPPRGKPTFYRGGAVKPTFHLSTTNPEMTYNLDEQTQVYQHNYNQYHHQPYNHWHGSQLSRGRGGNRGSIFRKFDLEILSQKGTKKHGNKIMTIVS